MRFTVATDQHGRTTITCAHCATTETSTSPLVIRAWKLAHRDTCPAATASGGAA